MRKTSAVPLIVAGCVGLALGLGLAPLLGRAVVTVAAQAPAPPAPAPVAVAPRTFKAPVGLLFSPVKPAQAAAFEAVIGRLRQALAASRDPQLRRQAAGWRFFKADEPGPGGSVLYVFVIDPTVPGADYTVSKILKRAYPDDDRELLEYGASFAAGQTLLNLEPMPAAPAPAPGRE
ncbi:MAG TPA: hypothetical protein VNE16_09295 [Vicinamibacterales bacterium]|nr:hypothetical protein [Vicinamibacterales bacterium]